MTREDTGSHRINHTDNINTTAQHTIERDSPLTKARQQHLLACCNVLIWPPASGQQGIHGVPATHTADTTGIRCIFKRVSFPISAAVVTCTIVHVLGVEHLFERCVGWIGSAHMPLFFFRFRWCFPFEREVNTKKLDRGNET